MIFHPGGRGLGLAGGAAGRPVKGPVHLWQT